MATSNGIDVSAYQGTQNWKSLAASGLTFAFAKASEGQHTRDTAFPGHIQGIIAAGLIPGAYHYGWPNQSETVEAGNYIAVVRPYARPGFIHALDLERRTDGANYAGATAAEIRAYATAWIAAVKKAFPGQRVGIYTSGSDITAGHLPGNSDFLWYPAYPAGAMTYAQAAGRARPAPSGRSPLFWQFTSTPGDRNIAYLSPTDLRAWAAGTTAPTVQEDDVTPADIAAVAKATADLLVTPKYRDAIAVGVLYWLAHGMDPAAALPTGKDAPAAATQAAALRAALAKHADGTDITDAQLDTLAERMVTALVAQAK